MVNLRFFDCTCEIGPYRHTVYRHARTADELIAEMDWCGIERALVSHTSMRYYEASIGNRTIVEETNEKPRLEPTWTILPTITGEQPTTETFIRQMRENCIRALRMFPHSHRYFLDEATWGDQLAHYVERRIPVFVKDSLDNIAGLLRVFPNLTLITGSQGFNPIDRYAWPLIERYPNLHYETSCYIVDGAIEEFHQRFGSGRLLFGTGYPDNALGGSILRLLHADIPDKDKCAIASGNLESLLSKAELS